MDTWQVNFTNCSSEGQPSSQPGFVLLSFSGSGVDKIIAYGFICYGVLFTNFNIPQIT